MSAAEETIKTTPAIRRKAAPFLERGLDFISAVRFGVVQLCALVVLAMAGMLILQQNVNGFDAYYVSLTPAEKLVFGSLGLFDIYHSWYFNLLLLSLSLNIILASIDRFPSAWSYLREPKLTATRGWLQNQTVNAISEVASSDEVTTAKSIKQVFETAGLKSRITESSELEYGIDAEGKKDFSVVLNKKSLVVFGQSGAINRLGAYIVHVA